VEHKKHNDAPAVPIDPIYVEMLKKEGVDEVLASHVASLFARDPIPAYSFELGEKQDLETVEHFENLQSSNWNSMRLKPPPSTKSQIGWRVEFRSMDIQLTDFENAAMIVLLLMLVNVLNNFDVDFITPISKVDENFERAHSVDGMVAEKFWVKTRGAYRGDLNTLQQTDFLRSQLERPEPEQELYEELSLLEILKGSDNFIGLYPLFEKYMELNDWTQMQRGKIRTYLAFLEKRASGEIPSGARMMRNFVQNHPDYNQDSIVNDKVGTDLLKYIISMNDSQQKRAEFLHGDWETRSN
jgi:glutamate--cysteine ligase catalytic subunit